VDDQKIRGAHRRGKAACWVKTPAAFTICRFEICRQIQPAVTNCLPVGRFADIEK
jgi:hypothetical protein